ncbi:MAG: hypothetical protein V3T17_03325 [Pseudomonadales bacterium]
MSTQDIIKIKVPHQELESSSFFDCEGDAVAKWVAALPMANLGQTTRQLYQALAELNQVRMLPSKRMTLLEKLRAPIYYVTKGLAKHYLNQAIVLAEQPRKVAKLAHTLHLQLATGYTIVATHTAALGNKHSEQSKPTDIIATALHRAITDHCLNMQRHYQLYQPVKKGIWHHLHQFYNLASQHNILATKINDTELGTCTVEESYMRALLMGCSKPNQLRQEDFKNIFQLLTAWTKLCQLNPATSDGLFVIDPTGDKSPVYRELYESELPLHWISFNIRKLVDHLKQLHKNANHAKLNVKDKAHPISQDLLGHLVLTWESMGKRTFIRLNSEGNLGLCIGLSATHHFVSGELSFEALVEEHGVQTFTMQHENPFLKTQSQQLRQKDVWDSPYEANIGQTSVAIESVEFRIREGGDSLEKNKYHSCGVQIVNSSTHGYCVEWPEDGKAHIKTGEIVGLKESHSHNWSVAVIRWVSHESSQHTQLGLELISPSAAPYGARIIHKTGGSAEYMRVLILPEVPATQQAVTLLTPRVPFHSGQKVILNQRAKEVQIQLGDKVNEIGAYNQFEFHRLTGAHTPDSDDHNQTDDFDSLWGNL